MNRPADHPIVTTLPPTDEQLNIRAKAAYFAYEDVRAAADHVYDLRVKVIRINLLGTLLHRPDPWIEMPAAQRDELTSYLAAQTKEFNDITALLSKGTLLKGIHVDICRWMHARALERPKALQILQDISDLALKINQGAHRGNAAHSKLLTEHFATGRAGILTAILELCEHLWADYQSYRNDEIAQSRKAAEALNQRLARLDRIGSHVRLVSLNATVEASRVGEPGRGLSIIAQEFKALAEEVKSIAREARADVSRMIQD